ncbi:MAG: YjdF family protein [Anaerovoracaceae bacterium]
MYKVTGKLTVFFQEPFWVGVFERTENGKLSVCKVTFGAEPRDYDVMDFVQKKYFSLKFSPAVKADAAKEHTNPKRAQREARKQTAQTGIGTKAQQALQLQREEMKTERRILTKVQREAEKERKFALKQQKRKEKHRGR